MVEGHQCHRVGHAHRRLLLGKKFIATSPNGRFAEGVCGAAECTADTQPSSMGSCNIQVQICHILNRVLWLALIQMEGR